MAETTLDLINSAVTSAYKSIYESSAPETVTYNPITVEEQDLDTITSQVSAALRPYYDSAIKDRLASAVSAKAEYDADAYSRGMGASTWLSDVKSRESMAAQSDISDIEGSFGGTLAETAQSQFQNYLSNKLSADTANAQGELEASEANAAYMSAYKDWVYALLVDAINRGDISLGNGGGGDDTPDDDTPDDDITKDTSGIGGTSYADALHQVLTVA